MAGAASTSSSSSSSSSNSSGVGEAAQNTNNQWMSLLNKDIQAGATLKKFNVTGRYGGGALRSPGGSVPNSRGGSRAGSVSYNNDGGAAGAGASHGM